MVNSKLIKTKLAGMDFWYRGDDKYVGQRIALGKYEEYETSLMLRQVRCDSVVVDVGANIGYYTLLMAQKAKRVYAIEPEGGNFEILKKNVTANKLKNVVLIKAAAGEKKGEMRLIKDKENFGNHRLKSLSAKAASPIEEREKLEKVSVIRLDDIFEKERVDLIKIDVQGWESAVIEGAKNIIKRDSPTLFLEYWPEGMKESKLDGGKMLTFLKTVYKKIWQIDDYLHVYKEIGNVINVNEKTGYADLWMGKELEFGDYLSMLKNVNYKNIIKGIIGYGKNK
jgi:FkbM family methyltransferase